MSEFIEELVASLKAVRDQSEERLKSVPAYSTYLEVAGLADKTAQALGPGNAATEKLIASLKSVTADYKEHLASVAEYRGLLAIDKCIADVAATAIAAEPAPAPAPEAVSELKQDTSTQVEQAHANTEPETSHQPVVASLSAEVAPIETAAPAVAVASHDVAAHAQVEETQPVAINDVAQADPTYSVTASAAPEHEAASAAFEFAAPSTVPLAAEVAHAGVANTAVSDAAVAPVATYEATAVIAEAPVAPPLTEAIPIAGEGAERAA